MTPRNVALFLGTVMLLTATTATADWSDNFNGGYQQATWYWASVGAGGAGVGKNSIVDNTLQLQDSNSAATGGAASAFGVVTGESFTDVRVYGTINPSKNSNLNADIGLLARINLSDFTGYALTLDFSNSVGAVDISRINGPTSVATLKSDTIPGFLTTDSVYAQFDLIGSLLRGRFYDQPGGTLLKEISTTDSNFADGLSGVVANSSDKPLVMLRGTYDDVGSEFVPEPASVVLFAVGGLCALGCFWRKRSRRKA